MTKTISVIIPVYNAEPYLRECLDSVCGQTFQNLEIILIDDGSKDNGGSICDEYAARDPRIRVIHQENQGISAARNTGLDLATGDLIGFMDSDDRIDPDMFQLLYDNLMATGADISTCAIHGRANYEGVSPEPFLRSREEAMLAVLEDRTLDVTVWNKLYKKELFSNIRFPVGRCYEDRYIIMDLLEQIHRMVSVNVPKYYYISRPGSITNRVYNSSWEDRIFMTKRTLDFAKEKYPHLIRAANREYIKSFWLCLTKLWDVPGDTYKEKIIRYSHILRSNLFTLLSYVPEARSPRYIAAILLPRIYHKWHQKRMESRLSQ